MTHICFVARSSTRSAARTIVAVLLLTVVAAGRQSAAGQMQAHAVSHPQGSERQLLFVDGRQSDVLQHVNIVQLAPSSGGTTVVMAKMRTPGRPLMRLIAAALAGTAPKTTIEVATFDYAGRPVDAITLSNARIQEIDLPELITRGNDPFSVTVKFFPTLATPSTPSEPLGQLPATKVALNGNFRLAIDSVDCSGVTGVEPLTITLPSNLPARGTIVLPGRPPVTMSMRGMRVGSTKGRSTGSR